MKARFALALSFALCAPCASAKESLVPPLSAMQAAPQAMVPVVHRFLQDRESLEHVHDIRGGARRDAAFRAFYEGWAQRLGEVDYDALGLEDQLDWHLLTREIAHGHAHGYPQRIVDHDEERLEALHRYEQVRSTP